MGFSQRFGRILRPKDETAMFYEPVTKDARTELMKQAHEEKIKPDHCLHMVNGESDE